MAQPAILRTERSGETALVLSGAWRADEARRIEDALDSLALSGGGELAVDCNAISSFDTIGAYLVGDLVRRAEAAGHRVRIERLAPERRALLDEVRQTPGGRVSPVAESDTIRVLSDIGRSVMGAGRDVKDGVAFLGAFMAALGRLLAGRSRLRMAAVATQLERVVLHGAPIIVLISFLVGAIIAQQSIFQLRYYGTAHLVADLLGILILRELAVLLTSIMIAGRSGSSFTAEIGSMKMREEVDAIQTMGLDPMEVLIVPRVLALILGLPLLTFISSMAGLAGGALVAGIYGGVSLDVFLSRLQVAIGLNTFLVGMIKAPFMALVIGLIASIEGFAVRGSAESLGQHTTASVVKSIFVVIVVDGLFAMFFAAIEY